MSDPSQTPTPPTETYTLTSDVGSSFDEGSSVTITLTTTNVSDGTTVPYTITGVGGNDIDVSLTGGFTIAGGQDTVVITATEDATTEGLETLTLELDNFGAFINLGINDTSTPTPTTTSDPRTYALDTIFITNINEGGSVQFNLTTTNVTNGELVPYTITGIDSNDIDVSLTGNFTVNNNSAYIVVTAAEDVTTESLETMTFTLDGLGESVDIDINDTSITPSPTPTPSPSYGLTTDITSVDEGQSITITLTATNVEDGVTVPYTITGIDANDIPLTDNFTILCGGDSITLIPTIDNTTEGTKIITFELDDLGESIVIPINDSSTTTTPTPSTTVIPPSPTLPPSRGVVGIRKR